ncbi:hypothetical protein D1AOALGA4SA_1542 [Olavius algarvensis Delta 1 endosymbiont]|nr:hypothetical protein D1AOALGA4SA_1542 [Olavius algarvensis Delta 1 endosymbiont]
MANLSGLSGLGLKTQSIILDRAQRFHKSAIRNLKSQI